MITLFFGLILVFFKANILFKKNGSLWFLFVLNVAWLGILGPLHLLEIEFMGRELFAFTDEITYYQWAHDNELGELISLATTDTRALFSLPQWFILNFDISFSGYALKLLNIPIILYILLTLYEMFPDRRLLWLSPIAIPYLYIMAFQNMRDPLIWLLALLIIKYTTQQKANIFKLLISLLLLFVFRGHMAFVLLIIISGFHIVRVTGIRRMQMVALCLLIGIAVVISMRPILEKYYYRGTFYLTNEKLYQKTKEHTLPVKYQGESNPIKLFLIGVSRQILTPRPTSKFHELFFEKPTETNLYMIDIARMVQSLFVYYFLVYIILHWKQLMKLFVYMPANFKLYGLYSFAVTLTYAIYYLGAGSSRTKMDMHIFIFLTYLIITNRKLCFLKKPAAKYSNAQGKRGFVANTITDQ